MPVFGSRVYLCLLKRSNNDGRLEGVAGGVCPYMTGFSPFCFVEFTLTTKCHSHVLYRVRSKLLNAGFA